MTNLGNYLYHARMAERYALSEMSDIDFRTKGVLEQMTAKYNKYDSPNEKPNTDKKPNTDQTSSDVY
ncbi:MAG: hypothetical protein Q7S33_05475 [Nanoarchaeota archaeon]|nr:hypothetical protein [Nanoarchaeota archaeon]